MSRPRTLAELAVALGGEVSGDGTREVLRPVPPSSATLETDLAVALQADALQALAGSSARMAILRAGAVPPLPLAGWVTVPDPRTAIARLLALFEPPMETTPGVHPRAQVEPGAQLGEGVSVGAFAFAGARARVGRGTVIREHVTIGADAVVGEGCLLHAGVRIGERVVLGDRVIVHANAVLGVDGFSHATPDGGSVARVKAGGGVDVQNTRIERIPSLGTVIIEDDVEIGAGTVVARATFDATRIGAGTKIDALVMIAHNTVVGRNCLIAAQAGISGSCVIGDRVVLAGQVGVADHLSIGDDAVVTAGAGVARSIPPRAVVMGAPAVPRDQFHAQLLGIRRLGRMQEQIAALQRRLREGHDRGEDA